MWLPEEIERIRKAAYKGLEDQKVEEILHPDDLKAIRETGTAIENIGNKIFTPKVSAYIDFNRFKNRYLHKLHRFNLETCTTVDCEIYIDVKWE